MAYSDYSDSHTNASPEYEESHMPFALENFFYLAQDLMVIVDLEGNFLVANPAFLQALGYEEAEIIGRNLQDFLHPDDIEKTQAETIRVGANRGSPYFENRYRCKDGSYKYLQWSSPMSDGNCIYGLARDVTEQKELEQRLLFKRSAVDAAQDGIIIIDAQAHDHPAIYVNPAFEMLTGYTTEEIIGQNIFFLLGTEPDQAPVKQLQHALENGEGCEILLRNYRKDDTLFWNELHLSPIYAADGTLTHFVALHHDATRRIKSQRQIEYHAWLLQNVSDAVISTDMDFVIQSWNKAAEALYGWKANEVIGRPLKQIMHMRSPSGESWEDLFPRFLEVGQWQGEIIQNHRDGSERYILSSISLIREFNQPTAIVAVNRDISDYKQQQRQLEAYHDHLETMVAARTEELEAVNEYINIIIDSASITLYAIDHDGRFQLARGHALARFGLDIEQLEGQSIFDVFAAMPEVLAQIGQALQGHIVSTVIEHEGDTFDSRYFPIHNEDGQLVSVVGVAVDVSDLMRTQQELVASLDREKALNALKTSFVSMASHELRNPLATILSSVSLLEYPITKFPIEKRIVHYKRIRDKVAYMISLLDDVLTISKTDHAGGSLSAEMVSLEALCDAIIEESQQVYEETHQIVYRKSDKLPTCLLDKALMRQVITNLLSNAVKYSPGSRRVDFWVEADDQQFSMAVRDYGIGIPPKAQEKLFQFFQRADNVGDIPGTGLGLAITARAVEMHGGEITCQSELGAGTTFTITIPIRTA